MHQQLSVLVLCFIIVDVLNDVLGVHNRCSACVVNRSYPGFLWYIIWMIYVTLFSLRGRSVSYTFNTMLIKIMLFFIFYCSCFKFRGTSRKSAESNLCWSVNRGDSWNCFSLICYWRWTDRSFVVYPHENRYIFTSVFRNYECIEFSAALITAQCWIVL